MNVMPIINILIVDNSGRHTAKPVAALHVFEETTLKLFRVPIDDSSRVLAKDLHLALVALAHAMALEPILISTLLLAHLTVPSELLETFGFDSVGDCFRSQEIVLPHWSSRFSSVALMRNLNIIRSITKYNQILHIYLYIYRNTRRLKELE